MILEKQSVLTLIFLRFPDRLDDFESNDLSAIPLHFDHLQLEGAIKKVWGFEATLFVDIELRKCKNKSILHIDIFVFVSPKLYL